MIKESRKNARFVSAAFLGYRRIYEMSMERISARDGGQRTSTRPASRLAFTLIELLVVIAVIAILASLLLSALSMAKVQARIAGHPRATCTSMGLGCACPLDDYKGYPSDPFSSGVCAALAGPRGVVPATPASPTQRTPGRTM